MVECYHYVRRCSLLTPCCQKVYSCRFCHNDHEDHELDRTAVEQLVCHQCNQMQGVSNYCVNCGIRFGMYACLECRLFDDTDKQQFHCPKCGCCRIGGVENFFHCDRCDICLSKSLEHSHTCRMKSGKDCCPVCFESVHSTAEASFVPQCGHLVHLKCFKLLKKFDHDRCPMCSRQYDEPDLGRQGRSLNIIPLVPVFGENGGNANAEAYNDAVLYQGLPAILFLFIIHSRRTKCEVCI